MLVVAELFGKPRLASNYMVSNPNPNPSPSPSPSPHLNPSSNRCPGFRPLGIALAAQRSGGRRQPLTLTLLPALTLTLTLTLP